MKVLKKLRHRAYAAPHRKTALLFAVVTMTAGTCIAASASVSAAADAIKSQGNIKFENGTPEDASDDVLFYAEDLHYLNRKVEEQIRKVTEGKEKIAGSITQKGESVTAASTLPTFDELSRAIAKIGTAGTAGAGDVLKGKSIYNGTGYTVGTLEMGGTANTGQVLSGNTFYSNSLTKQTGTMPNKAGTSSPASVSVSGATGVVSVPAAGYYDTSAKLTFDLNHMVGLIGLNGNAAPEMVLSGNTFYSNSLTKQTGTMPNNGTISGALNCGESAIIPVGYVSGGSITANSLESQTRATATADNISQGKTAWVNGQLVTGNGKDVSGAAAPSVTDYQIVESTGNKQENGDFMNHQGQAYQQAIVTNFQLDAGKTLLKDLMVYPIYAPGIKDGISLLMLKDGSPMSYDPSTGILSLYSEPGTNIVQRIIVWYS